MISNRKLQIEDYLNANKEKKFFWVVIKVHLEGFHALKRIFGQAL
jgi:hypothetical protein